MLGHVNTMPAPDYVPYSGDEQASTANSPVPIYCAPCGADRGGGFQPNVGVILCQDKIFSKKHVEDTLAHELIHEWDDRRFKVDWMNLRHVACSEVSRVTPSRTHIATHTHVIGSPFVYYYRFEQPACLGIADGAEKFKDGTLASQSNIKYARLNCALKT